MERIPSTTITVEVVPLPRQRSCDGHWRCNVTATGPTFAAVREHGRRLGWAALCAQTRSGVVECQLPDQNFQFEFLEVEEEVEVGELQTTANAKHTEIQPSSVSG